MKKFVFIFGFVWCRESNSNQC